MRDVIDYETETDIERLRKELKKYAVITGDEWKARCAYERIDEQDAHIELLMHTIDTLNARIKNLQAKIKQLTSAPPAELPPGPAPDDPRNPEET